MAQFANPSAEPKALLFDVFGTVVDWRSSVISELRSYGHARGLKADWEGFADDWRGLYQPSMQAVRNGERNFVILDELHRESLLKLISKYDLPRPSSNEDRPARLNLASPQTMARCRRRPLSPKAAFHYRHAFQRQYRPDGAARQTRRPALGHDHGRGNRRRLQAATRRLPRFGQGTQSATNETACLLPPTTTTWAQPQPSASRPRSSPARPNMVPHQAKDHHATRSWNVVTDSFSGLADLLNCPRF